MTLDITQFYLTFFDEADELLAQVEQLLLNLDIAHPNSEDLAAIFRAAHSIKGGAATFGFTALTETTHILESLLDRARNNELVLRKDMIDTFLDTKDVLSGQLADYRASAEPDAATAKAICAKLERLSTESRDGTAPAATHAAEAAQGGTPPEHVVEQAALEAAEWIDSQQAQTGKATVAGEETGLHLKITLRDVGEQDQELLAEELGNLGDIVGQLKSGGDLTLWLATDVTSNDIISVCCFVIDKSQIMIGCGTASADDTQQGEPETAGVAGSPPEQAVQPTQADRATLPAPAGGSSAPASTVASAPASAPASAAAPAEQDRKAARPAATVGGAEGSSIRVGVEKVDQLINLVGELVITQAMLAETSSAFDPAL
ncbi:Hpt domain-containing protein, partial [Paraburkholderia sp. SIMBA_027]|uniref:Hpt domain-containing protein n=1 Tax=Paraburkholderia sp. SIMBA_027 TaxID=3085770 RepID=UPI0039781B57